MAITLFTGLPGNGKTLRALWQIKVAAEKEKRTVYYDGINIIDTVALPWIKFDAKEWMKLPPKSMIVIDEAQDTFPAKANGSVLPDYYNDLAKHRHHGFDIFLITQHPSLIHNFVRKLVQHHFHSVRKFGLERAKVWEWNAANDSPEKPSSHKNAVLHSFKFPKEVYGWYKSAEAHTVKRSIPMKLVLAVLFVISVPLIGYYTLDRFQNRGKGPNVSASSNNVAAVAGRGVGGFVGAAGVAAREVIDPVADARSFMYSGTPRVVGLPHTAPKYDELTKPIRVPIPAACIQRGSVRSGKVVCKCFSQQGTPMPVEFNMCVDFAQNGFFQEFDAERQDGRLQDRSQGASQLAGAAQTGSASVSTDRVAVVPDVPEFQPKRPLVR
jgi:zona occludens toxin